jgi:hypothetical protein
MFGFFNVLFSLFALYFTFCTLFYFLHFILLFGTVLYFENIALLFANQDGEIFSCKLLIVE